MHRVNESQEHANAGMRCAVRCYRIPRHRMAF